MTARVLVAVCGLAALLLPGPGLDPVGVVLTVTGLVALFVAVQQPGSAAPLVLIGVAATSWLVTGEGTVRLVALAVCTAVVHSAAAWAAVVPPRTHVAAAVVRGWVLRTAALTAAGLAAVGVGTLVPTVTAPVATVVAGLLAALLLGAVALLPRRR